MGAVQRLATVVIIGLVALATVLVLYLADESNRIEHEQAEQEEAAIERGRENYLTLCLQCHGPAGEGLAAPGEAGTGRIGFPIGGTEQYNQLNQQGLNSDGTEWSNADFGSGVEGRANYIRNRIVNGARNPDGTYRMPAFGEDNNGPLNDEQVEELIVFIQHNDWNETYNVAIEEYDGYPTPGPAPAVEGDGDTGSAPTATTDQGGGGITVEMTDQYQFLGIPEVIPANTDVQIDVVNVGAQVHSFVVEGTDINSGQLNGGGATSVTLNLPPGTYSVICDVPGHKELGMVATLTVEEGAPMPGGAAAPGEAPSDAPADDGGEAATSGPITVEMNDQFQFIGVPEVLPANTDVVFDVVNVGAQLHSFVVEGTDINSGQLTSGQNTTVTINLPPGTYTYICDVPGHKELGMAGTFTVEEGAPLPGAAGGETSGSEAPPADAPAEEGAAATGPFTVDMNDQFQFVGVPESIPANTDVQIEVVNVGAQLHSFVVEGTDINSGQLTSGQSTTVTLNLPPGTYTYICDVPGHKELGMVGTLTVQ